jgi:SAM-dependent methyltransferase
MSSGQRPDQDEQSDYRDLSDRKIAKSSQRFERDIGILGSQITGLAHRLDRDVGILADQIKQLAQRFDTDLGIVATRVQELTEATRLNTGVLAKLSIDQHELGDRLRNLQSERSPTSSQGTGLFAEPLQVARQPVLERVVQAHLPEAIREAIWQMGAGREAWCLLPGRMPRSAEALPQMIDLMRVARKQLRPGECLVMPQSPDTIDLLSREETEQILGLIGPIRALQEIETSQGRWRVAAAETRTEAFAFALRWSISALDELHLRMGPLFAEALARFGLTDSFHGIELPPPELDFPYWVQLVSSLCRLLAEMPNAAVGIVLPLEFQGRQDLLDIGLEHIRRVLRDTGNGSELSFQWGAGSLAIAQSSALLGWARRYGLAFDFSPVNRDSHESRLVAYDDLSAYYPLDFDLRLPSYAPRHEAPIVVPRWSGRSLAVTRALSLQAPGTLAEEFDQDFEESCNRLTLVLDRRGRKEFERLSNFDPALMGLWPSYFVYNWPPPPSARLRLFEFDASELLSADSPLARLQTRGVLASTDPRCTSAPRFLELARQLAEERSEPDFCPRNIQITGHEYLRDRLDITADAVELISWMPARLGVTLELGSGYGVMARRVSGRADYYVGFDLTTEQARTLQPLGGVGLVADIHLLPFADECFDTIIADNVVEHAYDPIQVLSECRRVLRPGGRAFLIIPPDYLGPGFRNQTHFWKSDEASVSHAAETVGFRIIKREMVRMAELGIGGAHPSSTGLTGLWQIEKLGADAGESRKRASLRTAKLEADRKQEPGLP